MTEFSQEYLDYMQSEAWDNMRKQRLAIDGYTCQRCQAKNKPLDVHHVVYARLFNERMSDLESLCRRCHEVRHGQRPYVTFGTCKTCGEFLAIMVREITIMGSLWTEYRCADGHIRSNRT